MAVRSACAIGLGGPGSLITRRSVQNCTHLSSFVTTSCPATSSGRIVEDHQCSEVLGDIEPSDEREPGRIDPDVCFESNVIGSVVILICTTEPPAGAANRLVPAGDHGTATG